jgi:hypothetical protein
VSSLLSIPQWGSTRSINAGAASAVAMYEWCRRYATGGERDAAADEPDLPAVCEGAPAPRTSR